MQGATNLTQGLSHGVGWGKVNPVNTVKKKVFYLFHLFCCRCVSQEDWAFLPVEEKELDPAMLLLVAVVLIVLTSNAE